MPLILVLWLYMARMPWLCSQPKDSPARAMRPARRSVIVAQFEYG